MYSVILHCPSLGRDLTALRAAVPDAEVYENVRMANGAEACRLGHQAIVLKAAARNAPCVFVMEDDCQFTRAFHLTRWQQDARWADEHGFDVLVGGSTRTYDERLVYLRDAVFETRDGWEVVQHPLTALIEVSAFHSAHCVVYFRSAYAKVLNAVTPVDWSIGRDCGALCLLTWPFVAVQRPSFSGIEGLHVDYVPLYRAHECALESFVIDALKTRV